VQISYPGQDKAQFSVEKLGLSVAFMDLLFGKITVEDVTVAGLDANIRESDLPSAEPSTPSAQVSRETKLPELRVHSVSVTDSQVKLLDKAGVLKTSVTGITLVTGEVSKNGTTPVKFAATVSDAQNLNVALSFEGRVDYDLAALKAAVTEGKASARDAKGQYAVQALLPELTYSAGSLSGKSIDLDASFAPSGKLAVKVPAFSVKNEKWSVPKVSLSGTYEDAIAVELSGALSGRTDLPSLNPTTLSGTIRNTATASKVFPLTVSPSFDGRMARIAELTVGFPSAPAKAQGTYELSGQMHMNASLAGTSIREITSLFAKQDLVDGPVKGTLSLRSPDASDAEQLSGEFSISMNKGTLTGISVSKVRKALTLKSLEGLSFDKNDKTTFDTISAKGTLRKLVLTADPIVARDNNLDTSGRAVMRLKSQTVDARLVNNIIVDRAAGTKLKLPVTISGKLEDPAVSIDMATLLASYVKMSVKTGTAIPGKVVDSAKQSLKGAKETLKGLFR